jgi:hypothetical protein
MPITRPFKILVQSKWHIKTRFPEDDWMENPDLCIGGEYCKAMLKAAEKPGPEGYLDQYVSDSYEWSEYEELYTTDNWLSLTQTVLFLADDGEYHPIEDFHDPDIDTGDILAPEKEVV